MADPVPFLEHPDGQYETVLDAMCAAVERLTAEGADAWIGVSVQGMGGREDSYRFADVALLGRTIDVGNHEVNESQVRDLAASQLKGVSIERDGSKITLNGAQPRQVAVFLDVMFRTQLGIRGWPDQDDDYAVGFEW